MNLNKKAQTAIELVLVIGALLYFFIILLGAIQVNSQEKNKIYNNLALEEVVKTLQQEINLALDSKNGYQRKFELPTKILNNKEYEISINENLIYAITQDEKNSYSIETKIVQGQPIKGTNSIRKDLGIVYLNN